MAVSVVGTLTCKETVQGKNRNILSSYWWMVAQCEAINGLGSEWRMKEGIWRKRSRLYDSQGTEADISCDHARTFWGAVCLGVLRCLSLDNWAGWSGKRLL